jgi:hypothetical protein
MRHFLFAIALSCAVAGPAFAEQIPVDSPRWQHLGEHVAVVDYHGQHAFYLPQSAVALNDANFETGIIEFDMAMEDPGRSPSFPGVIFRASGDDGNYENFYLRPHQSANPDSNQYTPVINNILEWQLYPEFQSQMRYRFGEWFHVRLEIAEHSARIFVDSNEPRVIANLKLAPRAGAVALSGSNQGAYFANINITPGPQAEAPPEQPPANLPSGLVHAWSVSAAMSEANTLAAAEANHLNALSWTTLPVETNGVANLSRVATRTDETPMTLARFTVHSDRAGSTAMRFGFSDKVHVYLNGTLLFAGDDTQGSRDYRFLGEVGLWYTLQLPLRRGDNEIVFAVSDGAGGRAIGGGGWGALAAFTDMTGLTITNPH